MKIVLDTMKLSIGLIVILCVVLCSNVYGGQIAGVSATASSDSAAAARLVDGSGMSGGLHDNNSANMWFGTNYGANPHGGTVAGSYWIELDLGQVYYVSDMRIWNYNVAGLVNRGAKGITVEYSMVGGTSSANWTTGYTGAVPQAQAQGSGPSTVDRVIDFAGIQARYIVLTVAEYPNQNYYASYAIEAGLSEVQFYEYLGPEDCADAIVEGYGKKADLNSDCYLDLLDFAIIMKGWLTCMDPTDENCDHPWEL